VPRVLASSEITVREFRQIFENMSGIPTKIMRGFLLLRKLERSLETSRARRQNLTL